VQCLSGEIDADGKQVEMHYEMSKCAEVSEQYEALPRILGDAMAAQTSGQRDEILNDLDHSMFWYKMSVGSGGLLGQCFECMRVCPIATRAPLADPLVRGAAKRAEQGAP